jgi:hypothetical protein
MSLLVFTIFSNELISFTGQEASVRFDGLRVHNSGILVFAPLLASMLMISEKHAFAEA